MQVCDRWLSKPELTLRGTEDDISAAAHDMDSSDDGTPDAAPGPAPATGFTEKEQGDEREEPEMEMRMHERDSETETSSSEEEMDKGERKPGGVLSAILGRRQDGVTSRLLRGHRRRREDSGGETSDSGRSDSGRGHRRRRRASLRILRKRRRWDEHDLFSKDISEAGASETSASDADTSDDDRSRGHGHGWRHHHGSVGEELEANERGLASASSSRRSSQTTLTEESRRDSLASRRSSRSSLRSRDPRHIHEVRKARRAMKEDLNEPYIPAHRSGHTDPTNPGSSLKVNQYWDSFLRFCRLRSQGMSTEDAERIGVQTGQYRTIAALIIATSGLAGPAAPRLAHFAPASGRDAETNKGQRKLAEYTNPREKSAGAILEMTEDARQEASEMGVPLDGKEKVELSNEALMQVDKERGKGKPLRGRRHQREIKITRHIADILERQEFIEHLAKALVK